MLKSTTNWFARLAEKPWGLGLVFFLFTLPATSSLVGRFLKGRPIYNGLEFETVICAGQRAAEGVTRYPPPADFSCAGLETNASYVYLPYFGDLVQSIRGLIGLDALIVIYTLLFWAMIAAIVYIVALSKMDWASPIERVPFLGAITGSALVWGNVSGPFFGLTALVALIAHRSPLVFGFVIALVGSVKQVWLTALIVLLCLPLAAPKRWGYFLFFSTLGLASTFIFMSSGSSEVDAWLETVSYFALEYRPGQGFLGWFDLVGLPTSGLPTMLAWVAFSSCLALCAIGLCEGHNLSPQARVWVGLAAASLISPRLLSDGYYLLAPGMVAVALAGHTAQQVWVRPLIYGSCGLMLLMNVGDMSDYAAIPLTLASSVAILGVGFRYVPLAFSTLFGFQRQAADILVEAVQTQEAAS